jgi:GNAT superfamily N-acetyltransferase
METVIFSDELRDECASFWWDQYKDLPYVHRPDGYQNVNSPAHIGPGYFLEHLDSGLSCKATEHWHGEVRDDTIFVAVDGGKVAGILICSEDREASKGCILSAYVERTGRGPLAAALLLDKALGFFGQAGLGEAVAGPDVSKSLEMESPIHLALVDAGFAWKDVWHTHEDDRDGVEYLKGDPCYEVFLGGSLEGFVLSSEIERKVEDLTSAGITIDRVSADAFSRLDGWETPEVEQALKKGIDGDTTFVALKDGQMVGWLWEVLTWSCWAEEGTPRTMGGCVPEVVPEFRGRGIGKVLYHLGIEDVVGRGAEGGWTATGIQNRARWIYQSVG